MNEVRRRGVPVEEGRRAAGVRSKHVVSEIEPAPIELTKQSEVDAPDPPEEAVFNDEAYWPKAPIIMVISVVAMSLSVLLCQYVLEHYKSQALFTPESLQQYDGEGGHPIYLAILGEVFDVTAGARHYGKGGGYSMFSARDATRAFVTGEFEADLTDKVDDLSPVQMKGLVEWNKFYHKDYKYVGKLVGRFYDSRGRPTEGLELVLAGAERGRELEELQKKEEEKIPNCNMRWSQEEGGHVWCEAGMFPRKVMQQVDGAAPTVRCACFTVDTFNDQRQLYEGCDPSANECMSAPPEKTV